MNRHSLITFLLILIPFFTEGQEKHRVLVLTDIENEPDDAQSLVRFLTYCNQWDVEGLVATTSCWQRDEIADWRIHEIVDAYGEVRDNLLLHEDGYPTHAYLKSRIKKGIPRYGMAAVGDGHDSEGSEWVISVLEKEDARPVWITVWGGANVLAQALWKLRKTQTPADLEQLVSKLRVYTISDQDDSGPWIRRTFPKLFYIVSPGYQENGGGQYHFATWSGISGDNFHGRFDGPDFTIVDNPWLDEHIRQNHGPLGAEYPRTEYLMEGDSPSFLGLINNGLNDMEHPNFGGWGGRYEFYIPAPQKYFHEVETRPIWTNAVDEVHSEVTQRSHTSNHATIWRWREAYQHDFAARIDWTVKSFDEANHPPQPRLAHANEITVRSGDIVTLQADQAYDPDEDDLSYTWIYYREAGTLPLYWLDLQNADTQLATFEAPQVTISQTMHFVLAVTDDGEPPLTRYQRVIVNVMPK